MSIFFPFPCFYTICLGIYIDPFFLLRIYIDTFKLCVSWRLMCMENSPLYQTHILDKISVSPTGKMWGLREESVCTQRSKDAVRHACRKWWHLGVDSRCFVWVRRVSENSSHSTFFSSQIWKARVGVYLFILKLNTKKGSEFTITGLKNSHPLYKKSCSYPVKHMEIMGRVGGDRLIFGHTELFNFKKCTVQILWKCIVLCHFLGARKVTNVIKHLLYARASYDSLFNHHNSSLEYTYI